MKIIYFYDKKNKNEYLEYQEINDSFGESIPSSTLIEPFKTKKNYAICFNEESSLWEYVEDFRGKIVYSIVTKEESKVDYIGSIRDNYTLLKPKETEVWNKKYKKWISNKDLINSSILSRVEGYIERYIQKQIDIYNELNNVRFSSIHNCATYKDIETYSHQNFCKNIVVFNANIWEKGRLLGLEIEDGKREVISENEFISLLPKFVSK